MTTVRQTAADQTPVFWAAGPTRETLSASLIFRAGWVDETLHTLGWLHLLEHLALHDRGTGTLHVNGSVSLLATRFDVHGPPDAVVDTLAAVCRWLADPQVERAEHEAGVLRAESALRGTGGEVGQALLWRYGPQGPGLAGYEELGLGQATPEGLRALAARAFTAGNAALSWTPRRRAGCTCRSRRDRGWRCRGLAAARRICRWGM